MHSKLIYFVAGVYLIVMTRADSSEEEEDNESPCDLSAYRDCCPTMPMLIQEWSYTACIPTENDRQQHRDTQEQRINDGREREHIRKGRFSGSCVMECAFKNENYVTTGNDGKPTLNMNAIRSALQQYENGEWSDIINNVKRNCTDSYPNIADEQNCPSGANDMAKCLFYNMLSMCPSPTISTICVARLQKIRRVKRCKDNKKRDSSGRCRD